MSKKIIIVSILSTGFGFLAGGIDFMPEKPVIKPQKITPEISIINLKKISGDELNLEISGPARVLWAWDRYVENDGTYTIPLGQIPNENDLKFREFPYVGNGKTMKFYPSDSYFARGVELKHRRFFRTKEDALSEKFVASKGVD